MPCPKKDDKLIVSLNLKDIKNKVNVKDDDSCSSMMVSLNLSNIKCKPKDDKTKCIVKNDDSSLIVSLKLPSIRLKTSNSKKMMISSLLMKSLPIQIMLGGDKGIMFITLVMKNFKEGGVRF